jgi:hypothetical protein
LDHHHRHLHQLIYWQSVVVLVEHIQIHHLREVLVDLVVEEEALIQVILVVLDLNQLQLFMELLLVMEQTVELVFSLVQILEFVVVVVVLAVQEHQVDLQLLEMVDLVFKFQ